MAVVDSSPLPFCRARRICQWSLTTSDLRKKNRRTGRTWMTCRLPLACAEPEAGRIVANCGRATSTGQEYRQQHYKPHIPAAALVNCILWTFKVDQARRVVFLESLGQSAASSSTNRERVMTLPCSSWYCISVGRSGFTSSLRPPIETRTIIRPSGVGQSCTALSPRSAMRSCGPTRL